MPLAWGQQKQKTLVVEVQAPGQLHVISSRGQRGMRSREGGVAPWGPLEIDTEANYVYSEKYQVLLQPSLGASGAMLLNPPW